MNVSFLRARSLPKRRSIRRALRSNHDGAVEKGADDAAGRRHGGTEIVVAALVQISNGCIREETLFEQLAQLGVVSGEHLSENHAELGDVRALMALLVKRRIFMREHSSYDDPTMGYSYELAEGAEAIIGYENIDKFINESMRSQIATV